MPNCFHIAYASGMKKRWLLLLSFLVVGASLLAATTAETETVSSEPTEEDFDFVTFARNYRILLGLFLATVAGITCIIVIVLGFIRLSRI